MFYKAKITNISEIFLPMVMLGYGDLTGRVHPETILPPIVERIICVGVYKALHFIF